MNRDAILRSFEDAELEVLNQAMQAIVAERPLEPDEEAAYNKWHGLGGLTAYQRAKVGLEPKRPTTMDDLLDCFNDPEMDLLREAMVAIRDKQKMTREQEDQYARYLILGGKLAHLPYREVEEERIMKRYASKQFLARFAHRRVKTI